MGLFPFNGLSCGTAARAVARRGLAPGSPLRPPAKRPGPQHHHPDLRRKKVGCRHIASGRRCVLHLSIPSRSRSCSSPEEVLPPRGHLSGPCSQFPALRRHKQVYSKESFQERYFPVLAKGSQAQNTIFSTLHPLLCCFKVRPLSSETKYCQETPSLVLQQTGNPHPLLTSTILAPRRQTPRHRTPK